MTWYRGTMTSVLMWSSGRSEIGLCVDLLAQRTSVVMLGVGVVVVCTTFTWVLSVAQLTSLMDGYF